MVLSECDVDPMVYSPTVKGAEMKYIVRSMSMTTLTSRCIVKKSHYIHIATLWTCNISDTSNIVVASIWKGQSNKMDKILITSN